MSLGEKRYFGEWSCLEDVAADMAGYPVKCGDKPVAEWLSEHPEFPKDSQILWAWYGCESYEGHARAIFNDANGNLLEYSCSHCSCYGLEDTWYGSPVTWAALAMRPRTTEYSPDTPYNADVDALAAFWRLIDEHQGRGE